VTGGGSGGFTMDPDAVRHGAVSFGPAADDMTTAATTLQNVISSLGECWGTDESGKQFAQDYSPAAQNAVQAFGQLAQGLQNIQKNLSGIADGTTGTDGQNAQNLSASGQ